MAHSGGHFHGADARARTCVCVCVRATYRLLCNLTSRQYCTVGLVSWQEWLAEQMEAYRPLTQMYGGT